MTDLTRDGLRSERRGVPLMKRRGSCGAGLSGNEVVDWPRAAL
jgi:hypothetical protein